MEQAIKRAIEKIDHQLSIQSIKSVSGGDINQSFKVDTNAASFFVKANQNVTSDFFRFEKLGLDRLKETETVHIPTIYTIENDPHLMVMEWIDSTSSSPEASSQLGRELAQLHMQKQSAFGLDRDGYMGTLTQPNQLTDSWVDYYRDHRLKHQLNVGLKRGTMTKKRQKQLTQLMENLDHFVPDLTHASLLHGDLWGGNWLTSKNQTPFLIDPSIVYGDRHFELAFTELFGGFGNGFYDAYHDTFPIADYYEDIKPLYQLFHLLVHLNLFGDMYAAPVDRILTKYT
ncbi:Fructosamine-3-kinase [Pelagirhabdus alkalitolerans]|uniref:Fructosamine-3-kinase n=1 Tax=Pelagirhabdus alkalitolerans TaxID=1612202 RepID=A0A1G6GKK3_9BACI|nr:fructosamine kinase family protein [Pelagirhabdus alkalitolerans]SDB81706.1 Fructosamine-3-kinase [Pelagirhabdus alkalitolerans]